MIDLEPLLRKFVKAMGTLNIPYVIVGGFAIAGWGRPRATRDVDVIIQLRVNDIPEFVSTLRKAGFSIKPDDVRDALYHKEHFSIFNTETVFHVDAKGVCGKSEARTLKSRVFMKFLDYEFPISGLEDTIANKLRFGREQDLEDALAILVRNRGTVNNRRLEALCAEIGVVGELRALDRKAKRFEEAEARSDRQR